MSTVIMFCRRARQGSEVNDLCIDTASSESETLASVDGPAPPLHHTVSPVDTGSGGRAQAVHTCETIEDARGGWSHLRVFETNHP